ncbi:MAG: 3-dehydroquinate dehydratase [Firmicutes bacterium]|nr:3-dehydroquinate dehydratase [Bacillota bacterium]
MKVLIISGANLNCIEKRGSEYGGISHTQLTKTISDYAKSLNKKIETEFFVSNFEGELIEKIQNCTADALIINAGAYSHYSLAIADALNILICPKAEVHLTNVHKTGRHTLTTGASCDGVITGFGVYGYFLALTFLNDKFNNRLV